MVTTLTNFMICLIFAKIQRFKISFWLIDLLFLDHFSCLCRVSVRVVACCLLTAGCFNNVFSTAY